MPAGTKVDRIYKALRAKGYDTGKAARIAQGKTEATKPSKSAKSLVTPLNPEGREYDIIKHLPGQGSPTVTKHVQTPHDYGALIGAPAGTSLKIDNRYPDQTGITGFGGPIKRIERAYHPTFIHNEELALNPGHKGQGIGPKILANQVQAAQKVGLNTIHTYAGRNRTDSMIGYRVWPELGYDGDIPAPILNIARADFNDPSITTVQHLLSKPGGKEWWRDQGMGFDAQFDTRPGSDHIGRLVRHLVKRGLVKSKLAKTETTGDPSHPLGGISHDPEKVNQLISDPDPRALGIAHDYLADSGHPHPEAMIDPKKAASLHVAHATREEGGILNNQAVRDISDWRNYLVTSYKKYMTGDRKADTQASYSDSNLRQSWLRSMANEPEKFKGAKTFNYKVNPAIHNLVISYLKGQGRSWEEPDLGLLDEGHAGQVAKEYEGATHNPSDPEVAKSYDAFKRETLDQFKHMVGDGIKLNFIQHDEPAEEVHKGLAQNKLNVFTGGDLPEGHPLAEDTGLVHNGHPLSYNEAFRAVHDYFGHGHYGTNFGPTGEEHAYRIHSKMYSPEAQPAMATETKGQNSFLHFGPHKKETPADRPFAPQKATVLTSLKPPNGRGGAISKLARVLVRLAKKVTPEVGTETPDDDSETPWAEQAIKRFPFKPAELFGSAKAEKGKAAFQAPVNGVTPKHLTEAEKTMIGRNPGRTEVSAALLDPMEEASHLPLAGKVARKWYQIHNDIYKAIGKDEAHAHRLGVLQAATSARTAYARNVGTTLDADTLINAHPGREFTTSAGLKKWITENVEGGSKNDPKTKKKIMLPGGEVYGHGHHQAGQQIVKEMNGQGQGGWGINYEGEWLPYNKAGFNTYHPSIHHAISGHSGLFDTRPFLGKGLKIDEHQKNLRGDLNAVTTDMWEARLGGGVGRLAKIVQAKYPTASQHEAYAVADNAYKKLLADPAFYIGTAAHTRKKAEHLTKLTGEKWEPAEVQAAGWSAARGLVRLMFSGNHLSPEEAARSLKGKDVYDSSHPAGVWSSPNIIKRVDAKAKRGELHHDAVARLQQVLSKHQPTPEELNESVGGDHLIPLAKRLYQHITSQAVDPAILKAAVQKAKVFEGRSTQTTNTFLNEPRGRTFTERPAKAEKPEVLPLFDQPAEEPTGVVQKMTKLWDNLKSKAAQLSKSGVKVRKAQYGAGGPLGGHQQLVRRTPVSTGPNVKEAQGFTMPLHRAAGLVGVSPQAFQTHLQTGPYQTKTHRFELHTPDVGVPGKQRFAKSSMEYLNTVRHNWQPGDLDVLTRRLKDEGHSFHETLGNPEALQADYQRWMVPQTIRRDSNANIGIDRPYQQMATDTAKADWDMANKVGTIHGNIHNYLTERIGTPIVAPSHPSGGGVKNNVVKKAAGEQRSAAFVSPSTEDKDFPKALQALTSQEQQNLRGIAKSILDRLKLEADMSDAIGDWNDGAENSLAQVFKGEVNPRKLRYAAAWLGHLTNQKNVLTFLGDPAGKDALHEIVYPSTDMGNVRAELDRYGVKHRTLAPGRQDTKVMVYDQGHQLADTMNKFAKDHNASIQSYTGTGDFVGDPGWSSRPKARATYRKIISEYENSGDSTGDAPGGTAQAAGSGLVQRGLYYGPGQFVPKPY